MGFLSFPVFLDPLLSVAKKLGGKLEVVSFDDDLEGEFLGHEHLLVVDTECGDWTTYVLLCS